MRHIWSGVWGYQPGYYSTAAVNDEPMVCGVQCMMVRGQVAVVSKEDTNKEDMTLHKALELNKQTG